MRNTAPLPRARSARHPPLLDVLQLAHRFIIGFSGVEFAGLFLVWLMWRRDGVHFAASTWVLFSGVGAIRITLALISYPGGRPNAFFLRAFRSDRRTVRLRREIELALGPDFRVVGIRAPKRRAGFLLQVLLTSVVAIRYAGSKYFEMEAGDDWLLRLAASLERARLVILDLRDWTDRVGTEVELCCRAVGTERIVVLLADNQDSPAARREVIARLQGACLLMINESHLDEAMQTLRAWRTTLAPAPPGPSADAMAFARSHAPPLPRAVFWYRNDVRTLALLLGACLIMLGMARASSILQGSWTTAAAWTAQLFGIGFLIFLTIGVWRHWRRSLAQLRSARDEGKLDRVLRLKSPIIATAALSVGIATNFFGSPARLRAVGTRARYTIEFPVQATVGRNWQNADLSVALGSGEHFFRTTIAVYPEMDLTTEDFARYAIQSLPNQGLIRTGSAEIDGATWAILEDLGREHSDNRHVRISLSARQRCGYLVRQSGAAERGTTDRRKWNEVLNSFRYPRGS